ncbi:MAG: histidine phosphatase family protein [Clostridiales bacterium]|nr:histidine phosphatase family protein [Candidatus Crickella caballi]
MKKDNKDRKIYLIRHGEPEVPAFGRFFYSATDYPLSHDGRIEAGQTAEWLGEQCLSCATVVSSPLKRSRQTAEYIADRIGTSVITDERFREISCGEWEGLTFDEVMERYPDEFASRGKALASYKIPGGESFFEAGARFGEALAEICNRYDGDIIIVAHAGVIRGYLLGCDVIDDLDDLFSIPMPYAGITILNNGKPEKVGFKPLHFLNETQIQRIYRKWEVPDHIIRHMKGVADYQDKLLDRLEEKGIRYDRDALRKAALLHDIRRLYPDHAEEAGTFVREWGYPEVASLIANHHSACSYEIVEENETSSCGNGERLLHAEDILFYADKRVREDRVVSVAERFEASRGNCTTPEAVEKHALLYNRSVEIEKRIEEILKGEI